MPFRSGLAHASRLRNKRSDRLFVQSDPQTGPLGDLQLTVFADKRVGQESIRKLVHGRLIFHEHLRQTVANPAAAEPAANGAATGVTFAASGC